MRAFRVAILTGVVATICYRFWDMNQCNRACRVVHGTGSPDVLGSTGNWADSSIQGTRRFDDIDVCSCAGPQGALPQVARYHPPIPTKEQWWFNTPAVCGSDGKDYPSADAAHTASAHVVNCGQCGPCSTVHDTSQMHLRSRTLTKIASVGAIIYLFFGEWPYFSFMTSKHANYSKECAWCWKEATQCNLANCARHCLFGWQNPLSSSNNKKNGELNECLYCDEVYCSAYYLQACGANRRTSGVMSDISRPAGDICTAARADKLQELGARHPDHGLQGG
jgi:hypothetical protein